MFLRQLDLTTALRPSLYTDESLLFVQDGVGLYEGKFKIPNYQHGHVYLTTHRVCYVDNEEPRKYSVAVDLKEVERTEFYAGFLKSSAKITLFPKPSRQAFQAIKSPRPRYASINDAARTHSAPQSPAPGPVRDLNATWICPICGLSNPMPSNFNPATANERTPLSPCQACGIKPELSHMIRAAIAALSNRSPGAWQGLIPSPSTSRLSEHFSSTGFSTTAPTSPILNQCARCTFQNHPSLTNCELCGAPLQTRANARPQSPLDDLKQTESPGPVRSSSIVDDDTIETIKLSFRAGGDRVFLERLKGALVQRKWLLQSAPPVPQPSRSPVVVNSSFSALAMAPSRTSTPSQRVIGIAGLERREAEQRQNNQTVIGTAFEDLEALMTSAKEVIAMAEQFAKQNNGNSANSAEVQDILSESASALGLVTTKDMLGSGSASETLYISELSRNLAEFLADDRRGVLRREGGIMSLVDLWAVFNRTRNGIELISPLDFDRAAKLWDDLRLPIRLRRFKSGLLVVQERNRTDDKTIASLLSWVREPQYVFPPSEDDTLAQTYGRGITAQETAERFHWSVGVATEELEMAEETGALCRDQCLDGTRFWENHLMHAFDEAKRLDIVQTLDELRT